MISNEKLILIKLRNVSDLISILLDGNMHVNGSNYLHER
jgi:hypothetical protein